MHSFRQGLNTNTNANTTNANTTHATNTTNDKNANHNNDTTSANCRPAEAWRAPWPSCWSAPSGRSQETQTNIAQTSHRIPCLTLLLSFVFQGGRPGLRAGRRRLGGPDMLQPLTVIANLYAFEKENHSTSALKV